MYKVQDYIDIKKELEERKTDAAAFDIQTCTKEQMLERCREKGLSANSTQIAIAYFVDKNKSIYDIANDYGIEYDSARIRIKRIKQKLLK